MPVRTLADELEKAAANSGRAHGVMNRRSRRFFVGGGVNVVVMEEKNPNYVTPLPAQNSTRKRTMPFFIDSKDPDETAF